MDRRSFLWGIFTTASYVSISALGLLRSVVSAATGREIHLDRNCKHFTVKSGQRVRLPADPRHLHGIDFSFKKRGEGHAAVYSAHHPVSRARESLLLDQDCQFRLVFDARKSDWYFIRIS